MPPSLSSLEPLLFPLSGVLCTFPFSLYLQILCGLAHGCNKTSEEITANIAVCCSSALVDVYSLHRISQSGSMGHSIGRRNIFNIYHSLTYMMFSLFFS